MHIPLLGQPAGDGVSHYNEPKELFEAIYFGCRMEREIAVNIAQLVHEHLPDTHIYQARKGREHVRLELERLS